MITWTEDKGQGRSVEVPHTPTPRQGGLISLHLELRSWVQTCGTLALPSQCLSGIGLDIVLGGISGNMYLWLPERPGALTL